jgi:glutamine amidotransferase
MKKVAIVDYGLGNLFSIEQACQHVGLETIVTAKNEDIKNADAVILPGVGAFGNAMEYLNQTELTPALLSFIATGKPFMGICLGMQLLFSESEEFGIHKGLNLIGGKVARFPVADAITHETLKVPQIQWNTITKNTAEIWEGSPLRDIPENTYMHFVHSYYAIPDAPEHILSFTEYGGVKYASAVIKDNITGFQYHPEKSGDAGLKIYQTWASSIK